MTRIEQRSGGPWILMVLIPALGSACGDASEPQVGGPGRRATAAARPPVFVARRERPVGAKPDAILASDLDGDGFVELVATTLAPGALVIWRGGPAGIVDAAVTIPIGDYPLEPVPVRTGPAGEGRALAIASRADRTLVLLDPVRRVELWRRPLPGTPRVLAGGDLGADGSIELVVATDAGRLVVVDLEGELSESELGGELPRCLLVLADGSGVVVGFQATRSLHFFAYVDGALTKSAAPVSLTGIPRDLAAADLDGDGDDELIAVGGDRALWVFGWDLPGGPAAALASSEPPLEWRIGIIPLDVEVCDVDGDGVVELLTLHTIGLDTTLLGGFERTGPTRTETAYAGQSPRCATVADFTGDGVPDLALTNRDSHSVSLSAGTGRSGFAAAPRFAVGGFPSSIACGDFDEDGTPDVVVLNSKDESLSFLRGEGATLAPQVVYSVGPVPRAATCVDLDGDGHLDVALLTVSPIGAHVALWLGDGQGGLARGTPGAGLPIGPGAADLLAVDLTGDGRPELVVADDIAGEVVWFLNETSATTGLAFGAARRMAMRPGPRALTAAWLDGDATPEVVVALGGPGTDLGFAVLVARFDAAAGLELIEGHRQAVDGAPIDVVATDLDGDGREDLVVLANDSFGGQQGSVQVFLRAPDSAPGPFVALGPIATALHPRHVLAHDLNGDGLPELVVAAQSAHLVNVWTSRVDSGGGLRLERLHDLGAAVGCMDVAATDLDGDGWMDLVVANGNSNDVSVLMGRAP
ncbi:MAG: VCBS repeat-containing protein [Planctomycetota bacterium]|nr:MAG: VCBS repeat-containing protein [Planctomycetota bacterium]